ncbi:MAG TPA: lipocalin family protein, partial [Bacteroidia bacterium]|nr:lipocalin family protein [Bacteroidia bacterium]
IKIDDIYGQWWNDSDNNAAFSFYRDSLFYTDNKEYYKYQLKNDSLIIHYQDYTDKWQIIRVTNDSLIFKNRFHVIKELYRKDN